MSDGDTVETAEKPEGSLAAFGANLPEAAVDEPEAETEPAEPTAEQVAPEPFPVEDGGVSTSTEEPSAEPEPRGEPAAGEEGEATTEQQPLSRAEVVARLSQMAAERMSSTEPEPPREEQSRISQLEREVALLRSKVGAEIGKIDGELAGEPTAPPEEAAAAEEIDWSNPIVRRAIQEKYEEDPVGTVQKLTEHMVQVQLRKQNAPREKAEQQERVYTQRRQRLQHELTVTADVGETERAIVEDFAANRGNSLLSRYIEARPWVLDHDGGVQEAVLTVARLVEVAVAKGLVDGESTTPGVGGTPPNAEPTSPETTVRQHAARSTASNPSGEEPEPDPEEDAFKRMKEADRLTPELRRFLGVK